MLNPDPLHWKFFWNFRVITLTLLFPNIDVGIKSCVGQSQEILPEFYRKILSTAGHHLRVVFPDIPLLIAL
jgi:hypothetical protein